VSAAWSWRGAETNK